LAIARRCVEACGGKIAAQLAPSAGLVVSILLPRRS
jgi:signal transduction histidine kinase